MILTGEDRSQLRYITPKQIQGPRNAFKIDGAKMSAACKEFRQTLTLVESPS